MEFKTVSLSNSHFKKEFECGKELLDQYIKTQAKQDVKRKLSACFVLVTEEDKKQKVKGYYTLSSGGVRSEEIPQDLKKNFPSSYKSLPIILLGRLAIDNTLRGKGIGVLLLLDALERSYNLSKQLGCFAVVVDPIDDEAVSFYKKYGFILLPDSGRMVISMDTIKKLFQPIQ